MGKDLTAKMDNHVLHATFILCFCSGGHNLKAVESIAIYYTTGLKTNYTLRWSAKFESSTWELSYPVATGTFQLKMNTVTYSSVKLYYDTCFDMKIHLYPNNIHRTIDFFMLEGSFKYYLFPTLLQPVGISSTSEIAWSPILLSLEYVK